MAAQIITPKPVLLVDDSSDDALLMRRAFRRAGLENPLIHLEDGEKGIAYLTRCLSQPELRPVLILLDIKMPRMDGFETLKWIKSENGFPGVPVVMLTSSNLARDEEQARRLGADSFLTKPPSFDDLTALVKRIQKRWLILE